jgi:Trk K+ transport system NAD-binding subunit
VHFFNPGPQTHLFPEDRVFLLGSPEQNRAAMDLLQDERLPEAQPGWSHAVLEDLTLPEHPELTGRTLAQLDWPRRYNVQVVAVRPPRGKAFAPGADWRAQAGTEILLAGPHEGIQRLREALGGDGFDLGSARDGA